VHYIAENILLREEAQMVSSNNEQQVSCDSRERQSGSIEAMSDHLFEDLVSQLISTQFNKNPSMLNLERKPKADKGI
jgi:hypothetical protein